MKKYDRGAKKETTPEATAWPQGENVVELGEGVPRVSSRNGLRGPSHATLFRYASGKVKRPNVLTVRYVQQAIEKVTAELSQKQNQ